MATFSRTLEQTLRRALALANDHRHEYVTLEHLLLSLIDDEDAAGVMTACKVDLEKLRAATEGEIENDLFKATFSTPVIKPYIDAIRLLENKLYLNYNTLVLLYAEGL